MKLIWKRMKKNQKGFTLVELLVVVVILGILATLAIQSIGDRRDEAELAKNTADFRIIASALELFRIDGNDYPNGTNSDDALDVLVPDYIKSLPTYDYTNDGTDTITIIVGDDNTFTGTISY